MLKKSIFIFFSILSIGTISCDNSKDNNYQTDSQNPDYLHRSVKKLTDVIVYDIFSPPVASRVYAYPSIAAYEALIHLYPSHSSMANQLTGLDPLPQPAAGKTYNYPLASVHAFLTVGKALVFSEDKMEKFENEIYGEFKQVGIPKDVFEASLDFGGKVANHILEWADKDNYKQTRTFPKYTVMEEEAAWKPTPPDYMEGIEPHWSKIRPFVIDSATQFTPPPPTEYDMEKSSLFYKELVEVYETGVNLDQEQEAIAKFWDCNPYVSHHKGHAMFATKKITPGGHWIGITAVATKNAKSDLISTAEAYAKTSIALADAFISCWDEKWRSILVRPETLINQHIDDDWEPLLQTPPFPEYTSGHSVVSGAASTVLTDLFGDNFYFVDSTEVEYGLPPRTFLSFNKAAEEAAISRLYGGIHYMPAIENGIVQGRGIGTFIIKKLKTKRAN